MRDDETAYFGDLHNHCNISYAHGDLEDALANARQRLDFCSVTGHAHWPDMPESSEHTEHIVEFHERGFEKLAHNWADSLRTLEDAAEVGRFLTFPSFEVHSSEDGDRTVVYRDPHGELLYPESVGELQQKVRSLSESGRPTLALPHHIGYHQGARGINWQSFDEGSSPVVEVYSMHGAAETTEGPVPFLHSMGPADWRSTVQYGLAAGHVFGFVANSDHHSAHPGSYGHGMTGVWAAELTREALWDAIARRRTYALTGDKMRLDYTAGDTPMGGIRAPGNLGGLSVSVRAGTPIDYVDVVLNNRTVRRISAPDITAAATSAEPIRTVLFLEVGWGPRGKAARWEVDFGIEEGEILDVDPRFRGPDVLSPEQEADSGGGAHFSRWRRRDERSVHFETTTWGNPTSTTAGTQGMALEVALPPSGRVWAVINGVHTEATVERLAEGGKSGHLRHEIDSPAWLFHRAPAAEELHWDLDLSDFDPELSDGDFLYLRVRLENNQWAWGSPVFCRG